MTTKELWSYIKGKIEWVSRMVLEIIQDGPEKVTDKHTLETFSLTTTQ